MPPAILYCAIPVFLFLLLLEDWFSYNGNKHKYERKDTWSSLSLGIGNVIISFVKGHDPWVVHVPVPVPVLRIESRGVVVFGTPVFC